MINYFNRRGLHSERRSHSILYHGSILAGFRLLFDHFLSNFCMNFKFKRLCGYNMGEWRNSSYGGGAGGGDQKTFYCPYDMVYWLSDLSAPQGWIQPTPTNFCLKYACFFSGSIFACGHDKSVSTWLRASFQPIQPKGLTQWEWLNFY